MEVRIGSALAAFGRVVDRFMPQGYAEGLPLDEQLRHALKVPGLDAIALDYPMQFDDPVSMKRKLDDLGLAICTLEMGVFGDRKWKMGAFTAPDPAVRREAVDLVKRGMDAASTLGCPDILLWLGQDGYEYPFQADYTANWNFLLDGIREAARHRPDVKISLEYKPKEPRTRSHVANVGQALLISRTLDLANVGVTIDLGHALMAQECPAESVALLARYDRLFQVHVNDNYGDWDADLVVGRVNFWAALEFFYWLHRVGYTGWYLMDFSPVREDGVAALAQCIRNTRRLAALAAGLDKTDLRELQKRGDSLAIGELLWQRTIAQ